MTIGGCVMVSRTVQADDLLYFIVPKTYRPEQAAGLVVFMHGSGKGSPMWRKGTSPICRNGPDQHSSVPDAAHKLDLSRSVALFVGVHASACFSSLEFTL